MPRTIGTQARSRISIYGAFESVLLIGEVSNIFCRVSQDSRLIIIRHHPFRRLQNGRPNLAVNGTATTQR